MSSQIQFVQPLDVRERVPESAKVPSVSASSVVRGREKVKFVPSSGTTYASDGSQIITVRLSSANEYIDLSSIVLYFNLKLRKSVTTANLRNIYDNMVTSLIRRVKVQQNSVMIEDITDSNILSEMLVDATIGKDVYENQLGIQVGAWKNNASQFGVIDPTSAVQSQPDSQRGVRVRLVNAGTTGGLSALPTYANDAATESSEVQFGIPLSLLCGFCRQPTFFPLRNSGILQFDFYLEQGNQALVGYNITTGAPATVGGTEYTMSNTFVTADMLSMDSRYLQVMDALLTSDPNGYTLSYNTFQTQNANFTDANQKFNLVLSKASTQIRNIFVSKRLSADQNASGAYSISKLRNYTETGARALIGSYYNPQYGEAEGRVEQYNLTQSALGFLSNADAKGLLTLNGYTDEDENGRYVLVFGYDRVLNEDLEVDGFDSSVSGGLITLTLTQNASGAGFITAGIEYTRFLTIRGATVSVVG